MLLKTLYCILVSYFISKQMPSHPNTSDWSKADKVMFHWYERILNMPRSFSLLSHQNILTIKPLLLPGMPNAVAPTTSPQLKTPVCFGKEDFG